MNFSIKFNNMFKIFIVCLIAVYGTNNLAKASEPSKKKYKIEQQFLDNLFALYQYKKYDDAFDLLNQYKEQEHPTITQHKGYLLGSGSLSSGKDLCGAIKEVEKTYVIWRYMFSYLNQLYGGDWASIAAIEGNREALFNLGENVFYMQKNTAIIQLYDDTLVVKEAYRYFFNAEILGHLKAKEKIIKLEQKYPDIDFTKYQLKMKFKEIHCPVRKYEHLK